MKFGLIIGGIVLAICVFFVGTYVKYANMGVTQENGLEGIWQENAIVLNNYTTKVQEVAQVPDMYKNDLRAVIADTFSGRYGENGSKAVVQFITENNPSLDPTLYRQIQQVMESGRNDFKVVQKKLVDAKMNYKASLDYVWSGFWLRMAGYPKVDLNKYKIIQLGEVENKMNTGRDSVIKLR